MKMQFRRPYNRILTPAVLKIGGVCAALLALALATPGMPDSVKSAAIEGAKPVWSARDTMLGAVYGAVAILETKEDLVAKNNELYEEISALRRLTFESEVLREENKRLRGLLNRPEEGAAVAAGILSRPSWSPYDTFVIDAGEREGIVPGNIVTVEGNVAIGTVSEAFERTATVMLFSGPGQQTPVLLSAGSTTPAVAEGYGGGNFAIHLPRDAAVAVDDPVILPTLSPHVFAVVESVERDPTDSFQIVRFRAPVNYATLRHVLVVTGETFDLSLHASSTQAR